MVAEKTDDYDDVCHVTLVIEGVKKPSMFGSLFGSKPDQQIDVKFDTRFVIVVFFHFPVCAVSFVL